MVEITIASGETDRIVGRDQANRRYTLEVVEGPIRLHHDHRYAPQGTKYNTGDRGELQRLEGQPLFAHNPSDSEAKIEISKSSFLFSLFTQSPEQVINVQNRVDRVVSRSDYFYEWKDTAVGAGSSANVEINLSSSSDPVAVEGAQPSWEDYVEDSQFVVLIKDESGTTINSTYVNPVQGHIEYRPPVRMPPGGKIIIQGRNNSGSSSHMTASVSGHYLRD